MYMGQIFFFRITVSAGLLTWPTSYVLDQSSLFFYLRKKPNTEKDIWKKWILTWAEANFAQVKEFKKNNNYNEKACVCESLICFIKEYLSGVNEYLVRSSLNHA